MRLAAIAATALVVSLSVAAGANAAEIVKFVPGTYDLAQSDLGPPVDTLIITVSQGTASFLLSGADTAAFSLPDGSTPLGGDGDPFFAASPSMVSWDATQFPFITFWSNPSNGGFTVGSSPGDAGNNLFNTFESTLGTGQLFTITNVSGVPEPATWALLLSAVGVVGLSLRIARTGALSGWRRLMGVFAVRAVGLHHG